MAIGLLRRLNCSATLSSCRPSDGFTSTSTVRMPYIFGEAYRAQLWHVRVVEPATARLCNSEQPETPGSDVDVLIIGSIDFGTVVDALHTAQQRLARDICRG